MSTPEKPNLSLLFSWDLPGRIPPDTVLDRTRVQESWLFFKNHLPQAQE